MNQSVQYLGIPGSLNFLSNGALATQIEVAFFYFCT